MLGDRSNLLPVNETQTNKVIEKIHTLLGRTAYKVGVKNGSL